MKKIYDNVSIAALSLLFFLTNLSYVYSQTQECVNNTDCNNGSCVNGTCVCNKGFITFAQVVCNYEQKEKKIAFLFSLLIGFSGAEWIYLACNNMVFIYIGAAKLLLSILALVMPLSVCLLVINGSNCGKNCFGILLIIIGVFAAFANSAWVIFDFIRIMTDNFKDGNNVSLKPW